eukprot:scaffold303356_cov30-Tisochrysis_lutea.AAC.2
MSESEEDMSRGCNTQSGSGRCATQCIWILTRLRKRSWALMRPWKRSDSGALSCSCAFATRGQGRQAPRGSMASRWARHCSTPLPGEAAREPLMR